MSQPELPPRVLLVEGRAPNLLALEAMLEPLGCALTRAQSGEEALAQLAQGGFALALLAVEPPEQDGHRIARLLRSQEPNRDLPILFLTAPGRPEASLEEGYALGTVDYAVQPGPAEVLRLKAANLLAWSALRAELRAQEERHRFLAEASAELASTLEVAEALRRVVRLAVPRFADFAAADLLDEGGETVRVALAHVDPAREARAWAACRPRPGQAPAQPGAPVELGLRSALVVPLLVAGRALGSLTFAMSDPGRGFSAAERALAEDLARRAAVSVENARLYTEAREANRLKDEFLSMLSHELRTPLTAILGWAQLLRSRALSEAQRAKAAEVIERNAHAQRQLVEDLLDVARIASNKLEVRLAEADLHQVVEAALDAVRPQAEAKGVRLLPTLGRLPPVLGDAERLGQVVWNLLVNAVKFTPAGGRVQVGLEAQGLQARLTVDDSGQGIEPELLPHVFERFRQGSGPTVRAHRGLGLGLSIVRHLVELHRGEVEARSPGPGRGATFVVRLPLLQEGKARVPSRPPPPGPSLAGLRVLVVEDDPDARELLRTALEQGGARVTTAASAEEAYAWFGLERPTVLLCDIQLPLEDGYGLIRRLRERGERVPAVALTAFAAEADRARAEAAGFDRHLAKPVETEVLLRAVAELATARS